MTSYQAKRGANTNLSAKAKKKKLSDSKERFVEIIVDFLCSSLSLMQVKNCDAIKAFVYSVPRSSIISRSQSKMYSHMLCASMSFLSNAFLARVLKSCGAEKYKTEY